MNKFAKNIKTLRSRLKLSQAALAERIFVTRASLAKYEGAVNEPPFDVLIRLSRYFKVSTDVLLTADVDSLDNSQITVSENQLDTGLIMPIQVDKEGENVVEIIPHSAKAGYTSMYSDPGFIESLDHMALPFNELYGKCRAFPIEGDSMPPIDDGSYVIARHISSVNEIKDGSRYVVLSRDQGIVFKRIYNEGNGVARLNSDNPKYDPIIMNWSEIVEVWEFVGAISFQDASSNYAANEVINKIGELQQELKKYQEVISRAVIG